MGVSEEILDRLARDGLPQTQADLVVAALISDDELARTLTAADGGTASRPAPADTHGERGRPKRAYLASIAVEGFRGIGPRAELQIKPGPGLTLVIGRNGSGKSSFAEAAELALTGDNRRWSGPGHSVERSGWRNLHQKDQARIDVAVAVDGVPDVTTVTREWAADDDLGEGRSYAQPRGKPREPVGNLGWTTALELYRPFLSYSELGALVSGKPSQMHDALEAILGLDQLKAADTRLGVARKRLDATGKEARNRLPAVRSQLEGHPDERAAVALAELAKRVPDLNVIAALASGGDVPGDDISGRLRQVTAITLPAAAEVAAAIKTVENAQARIAELAGTPAADARRLARLLGAALDHQKDHDGQPCPVCGARRLDAAWAETARKEAERLTRLARDAETADTALTAAQRELRELVQPSPPVLKLDLGDDADPRETAGAWRAWAEDPSSDAFTTLENALASLQALAAEALRRRAEAWRPVAVALGEWVGVAKESRQAATKLGEVKSAVAWLKAVGSELRNERLEPFSEASARVWEMLRQESNVELGPVTLAGSGPQRKVSLDVTVDGEPGAALSVMSQGELHALGLALFLPRATAAESPFGFIMIDDPVQSMDPAKVDGLARLLADVGRSRQVVVFTHDDRLPAAVRQLQLPATIWEVTRREQSMVSLTRRDDAVQRYIEDAIALAMTQELDGAVKAVAVAGLCRCALEAACVEVVRARRIGAGMPHTAVEEALEQAQQLRAKLSLALFDDADRGGDVVPALDQLGRRTGGGLGQAFVDVFRAAKDGPHQPYTGDLKQLARNAEKLAKALRR